MPESERPRRAAREPITWRSFFRPGRTQFILALALALVAGAGVMQIHSTQTTGRYASMRRADLVQMLDGLNAETRRLNAEIEALRETKADLESGADSARVAEEQARRRLDALAILAGTAPAVGPGIIITIEADDQRLGPEALLDAVQELRDAGGEAIEFNDVRVVAQTWFGRSSTGLLVDGKAVTMPLTIRVIGEPHVLEEGARFRGGLVSQIESDRVGGQVSIRRSNEVRIDSLYTPETPEFAKPA